MDVAVVRLISSLRSAPSQVSLGFINPQKPRTMRAKRKKRSRANRVRSQRARSLAGQVYYSAKI